MTLQSADRANAQAMGVTGTTAASRRHSLVSHRRRHDLKGAQVAPAEAHAARNLPERPEDPFERSTHVPAAHARQVGQLFEHYHLLLVRLIARRIASWEVARDLASQAFAQLLAHKRPGTIRFLIAYLYRTAHNLTTNHLLREAVQREHRGRLSLERRDSPPTPEQEAIASERHAILDRALRELPPAWRLTLTLRLAGDDTPETVADQLSEQGLRVGARTARRYFQHAVLQCRRVLIEAEHPTRGL